MPNVTKPQTPVKECQRKSTQEEEEEHAEFMKEKDLTIQNVVLVQTRDFVIQKYILVQTRDSNPPILHA